MADTDTSTPKKFDNQNLDKSLGSDVTNTTGGPLERDRDPGTGMSEATRTEIETADENVSMEKDLDRDVRKSA